MIRYALVRVEKLIGNLITRRSQVQILPPPPTKMQVRPHFSEWGLLLCPGASTVFSTVRRAFGALARSVQAADLRVRSTTPSRERDLWVTSPKVTGQTVVFRAPVASGARTQQDA